MATVTNVGDILELKVGCFTANQAAINVYHYLCDEVVAGGTTDADFALTMDAALAARYKGIMHNTASYYGTRAQIVNRVLNPVAQVSTSAIGVGTGGADPLPLQTSLVITRRSAFVGRRNRGRNYLPFPPAVAMDAATKAPTAAYKALCQLVCDVLQPAIVVNVGAGSTTYIPVIRSSKQLVPAEVIQVVANQKFGTQRRRGNYGQANAYPPF